MTTTIKAAREALGLTQQQLADLTGLDQPKISRYERGTRPSVDDAPKIARALNVPVLDLLYPDEQKAVRPKAA